jgi:hypothetical protein
MIRPTHHPQRLLSHGEGCKKPLRFQDKGQNHPLRYEPELPLKWSALKKVPTLRPLMIKLQNQCILREENAGHYYKGNK